MSHDIELWRGAAQAWECDHLGHLNTRFYLAKVEQALPGLIPTHGNAEQVVAAQHVRFHKEVRAGTALHATGRVLRWSERGGELLVSLRHSATGDLAATCRLRYGDPAQETADVSEPARERGLSLASLASVEASGRRAEALGLDRTGLTTALPNECDAAGRWRLSATMGMIADASLHLRHGDWRDVLAHSAPGRPARIGNVLLEIGIVHHHWPRLNARVEVRSALADCTPRITRTAHWLLEPGTGRPWATVSAVGMPLDLDTRRPVALTPEAQAAFRATAVEGV